MKYLKKFIIWKLVFLILFPINGWSQAQPVAQPDRVARAVSGVLQQGMQSRGFAANDPRFISTLAKTSATLAVVGGGAAAVATGAVTAPAWVTAGVALVVGSIVSYFIALAIDGAMEWLFRTDGKIDESPTVVSSNPGAAMVKDGSYWSAYFVSSTSYTAYSGDGLALARENNKINRAHAGLKPEANPVCTFNSSGRSWSCGPWGSSQQLPSGAPASCPSGAMYAGGSCIAFAVDDPIAVSPISTTTGLPIGTAIAHIPQSDYDKQLNPTVVAALADRAWQKAASQPGYDGLPYPQSNPITGTEVSTWTKANPDFSPTVRDFISPNPATTANPSPFSLPSIPTAPVTTSIPTTNSSSVNPAAANPLTNLGPDPAVSLPTLEEAPSAHQILTPLIGLMPDLRNFQVPSHSSKCPVPEFDIWSSHFRMDAHCALVEENISTIQATFSLVWALMALFIVLSA